MVKVINTLKDQVKIHSSPPYCIDSYHSGGENRAPHCSNYGTGFLLRSLKELTPAQLQNIKKKKKRRIKEQ